MAQKNHELDGVQIPHKKRQFLGKGSPIVKYRDFLPWAVQKCVNRSICRLGCGLRWAKGSTNSITFARWRQCAHMGGHIDATWRIRLNRLSAAAMWSYVKLLQPFVNKQIKRQTEFTDSESQKTSSEWRRSWRQASASCLLTACWCNWLDNRWKPRRLSNLLLSTAFSSDQQQRNNYTHNQQSSSLHTHTWNDSTLQPQHAQIICSLLQRDVSNIQQLVDDGKCPWISTQHTQLQGQ